MTSSPLKRTNPRLTGKPGLRGLALTAAVSACLSLGVPAANAADPVAELGQRSSDGFYTSSSWPIAQLSWNPSLTPGMKSVLEFFEKYTPWKGFPLWVLWDQGGKYDPSQERDYQALRLIKRVPEQDPRVERLFIESPSMRRVIEVQVVRPRDHQRPAPMVYLLDGGPARSTSEWVGKGKIQDVMANEHATWVMPVSAAGQNYTNWQAFDPIVGRPQWETFLIDELPAVLERQANIPFDGNRYIGGISMGASAAIRLASMHHERFAGAFGLSGCYSTTSTVGRSYVDSTARAVGADPFKMWGPGTSAQRMANDVTAHPEGLATMPLYFYTGSGNANNLDAELSRKEGLSDFFGNIILEKQTEACTHEMEDSLRSRNLLNDSIRFDYTPDGTHEWYYFGRQYPIAWQSITGGKYTYRNQ